MSERVDVKNGFLSELLALQQDGKDAISAPSNWMRVPLLEVREEEIDGIIDDLQHQMLRRDGSNETARWHFFVGSPGNGKSAATGKLCRALRDRGCGVYSDDDGKSIEELDGTSIPYMLRVKEGAAKFSSAMIIQDTSVVRRPFEQNIDPAEDLLKAIEFAWEKGNSLVVCANRGVLEQACSRLAHRENHGDWPEVLQRVVDEEKAEEVDDSNWKFEDKKAVFKHMKLSQCYLDKKSLLLGNSKIFKQLLDRATDPERWKVCHSCPAHRLCPFKANRDWLADEKAAGHVQDLLARAEVLSGQVIVFREMLAIISFLLAGCPADYKGDSPCMWVQERAKSDDVFSLATRRLYMCLFSSFAPMGLEVGKAQQKRQREGLADLSKLPDLNKKSAKSVKLALNYEPPSTDVGVTRLLGRNGFVSSLDPCLESLPARFFEDWNSSCMNQYDRTRFTQIEERCVKIWRDLEACVEFTPDPARAHWALQRWSSNFLLHLGGLYDGRTAWYEQVKDCKDLLDCLASKNQTIQEKKHIKKVSDQINELLIAVSGKDKRNVVRLSSNVFLSGDWVVNRIKPKIDPNDESGSISLLVCFPRNEDTLSGAKASHLERVALPTRTYLWLKLRAAGKLIHQCFPAELLSGALDAKVRAASKSGYAFAPDDVELIVHAGEAGLFRLARFGGQVDVVYEDHGI